MKLLVNDDGTTIAAKDWVNIYYSLAMADTPLGKNYHFIALETQQEISQLLRKYDDTSEIKIYFYGDILIITFDSEQYHYTIDMSEPEFNTIKEQFKKEKKILFALLNQQDELEYYYSYNIII